MREIAVRTSARRELVDITEKVAEIARESDADGVWLVYVPHTTAGVTINEGADPDVATDIVMALESAVPDRQPWKHAEGNSPAHVMSSLVGSSVLVAVSRKGNSFSGPGSRSSSASSTARGPGRSGCDRSDETPGRAGRDRLGHGRPASRGRRAALLRDPGAVGGAALVLSVSRRRSLAGASMARPGEQVPWLSASAFRPPFRAPSCRSPRCPSTAPRC